VQTNEAKSKRRRASLTKTTGRRDNAQEEEEEEETCNMWKTRMSSPNAVARLQT